MIWQLAQVRESNVQGLSVRISAPEHCRRCARGQGCGAGVFSRLFSSRETRLALPAAPDLDAGDWVRVGVTPQALAISAARHYGLALLGLLAGAWIGHGLAGPGPWQDPAALMGGLAGLAATVRLVGRRFSRMLNPVVERLSCPDGNVKSSVSSQ